MKRSLRAEELSLPARCLCGVSQMLRLILPSPAPLRDREQVKHSQLPRTIEYLWIPLITEAGTIPTSLDGNVLALPPGEDQDLLPQVLVSTWICSAVARAGGKAQQQLQGWR